jgi:undecaprenyl-diphosphatase
MSKLYYQLGRFQAWDQALCLRLNHAAQPRPVFVFFRAISRLGDGVFWYSLLLALLLWEGLAALPGVLHMMAAGLTGTLLYKWLKGRTSRPRPYQSNEAIVCRMAPLDQYSFPSGHTLHAVVFTAVALAYFPWLGPLLVSFTVLVGLSRVLLGLHYPSDVLAGGVIGALTAGGWLLAL